jgi:hypothetical protein
MQPKARPLRERPGQDGPLELATAHFHHAAASEFLQAGFLESPRDPVLVFGALKQAMPKMGMPSLPNELAHLEGKKQNRLLPRQPDLPGTLARGQVVQVLPVEIDSARPRLQVPT